MPGATSETASSSLLAAEAAGQDDPTRRNVPRTELDPHRHALELPLGELVTRAGADRDRRGAPGCRARPGRRAARPRRSSPTRAPRRTGRSARSPPGSGATAGGRRSPASSPWAMIVAPTMRGRESPRSAPCVLRAPSAFRKVTSYALAKFWPRKWLVPHWSAFPSRISPRCSTSRPPRGSAQPATCAP